MTLTAIGQPGTALHAPRVRLELDAGPGNTFVSLAITRDGRPLSRTVAPDGIQQTFAYFSSSAAASNLASQYARHFDGIESSE